MADLRTFLIRLFSPWILFQPWNSCPEKSWLEQGHSGTHFPQQLLPVPIKCWNHTRKSRIKPQISLQPFPFPIFAGIQSSQSLCTHHRSDFWYSLTHKYDFSIPNCSSPDRMFLSFPPNIVVLWQFPVDFCSFWIFGSEGMRSARCQCASGSWVRIPECWERRAERPTPNAGEPQLIFLMIHKSLRNASDIFLCILFPYNLPQKIHKSKRQRAKALTRMWCSLLWKCFEFAREKFLIANIAKLHSLSIKPNNQVSWKTIMCH